VLVATSPVDLRGSFNRLYGLVVEQLKADPLSGNLFLFINRRRNRIKILVWDGSGLWICAKRLEQGKFTLPVIHLLQHLKEEELASVSDVIVHGDENARMALLKQVIDEGEDA